MPTVTATELARSTREILDRVSAGGETVLVERNSAVIARISPPEKVMTAAQALAGLRPALTPQQAEAWREDSRGAFDEAVRDPWA